jgi:hypothetical protein
MLIKKNGVILNVTKGAYKASFATLGWEKVDDEEKVLRDDKSTLIHREIAPEEDEEKVIEEVTAADEVPFGSMLNQTEEYEEEMEDDEEVETPLTEMTVKELEDLAEEYGIELGKAARKKDIIEVISKALYNEE